jgi:hypothetical protein
VLASANFLSIARRPPKWPVREACFGATPKPARETRALPQARVFARLLCAFFERSRFTAQIGENFTSEMQRAGNQDRIWFRARKYQRLANG